MMFEPPEPNQGGNTKRGYMDYGTQPGCSNHNNSTGNSPLLNRISSQNSKVPPLLGPNLNSPIYNRIGKRNFQNNSNKRLINKTEDHGGNKRWISNNRKRRNDDNSGRFNGVKRRWNNTDTNAKINGHANTTLHYNKAQERLNRIRRRDAEISDLKMSVQNDLVQRVKQPDFAESSDLLQNDVQDGDEATDITVQIINNTAVVSHQNDVAPERFKMVLNPRIRSALIKLQANVKRDKYVITSIPFTPNCTKLTLHQRFALL